jgi:hypothetical protein
MQGTPGLTEAQVRAIVQQELQQLRRESLPASMRTKVQTTAEQRIDQRLNITSRTKLLLDDLQPPVDRYLSVDANGFAVYKQIPYSAISGTPAPFVLSPLANGSNFTSDPAAGVTAVWNMSGDGTPVGGADDNRAATGHARKGELRGTRPRTTLGSTTATATYRSCPIWLPACRSTRRCGSSVPPGCRWP